MGGGAGAALATCASVDTDHSAGAPAAAEARFRLDSSATDLAATGAGVEGVAWPGSRGDLPFELRARRDRLL